MPHKDPEKRRAWDRARYWASPEKKRARDRARYWASPGKQRARKREWDRENREKINARARARYRPITITAVNCAGCGKALTGRRGKKFCSLSCRRAKDRALSAALHGEHGNSGISSSSVGAMHELVVSADLIKRGYEVFRAVSPANSCDLIILTKARRTFRVEVTTGHYTRTSSSIFFPPKKKDRFDLLAVVLPNWKIQYIGELP